MTVEKKEPFSLDWKGDVLEVSKDEEIARRYDFSTIDAKLNVEFLRLGQKTKLINFKASAKKLGADPLAMMDEGFKLLQSGEWEFEREGIVRAPEYLIRLVVKLLGGEAKCSRASAEVSLKAQKDTWPEIEKAHAGEVANIKKAIAAEKDAASKNVKDLSSLVAKA